MKELVRAAAVIARRDFIATVWSKTFLFFLIGPLFPIVFAFVFTAMGTRSDEAASRPVVAVLAPAHVAADLQAAEAMLRARLGERALPELSYQRTDRPSDEQAARLLADKAHPVSAVLSVGGVPSLSAPPLQLRALRGELSLLLDVAARDHALGEAAPAATDIRLVETASSVGFENTGRHAVARGGQLVLVMLTMILAGMLLSNLIEEKSNKVIEVLAAAVPVDAIFLGKLVAMLGMSMVGIAVWGGGATAALLIAGPPIATLPVPAVGWPAYALLGIAYFTASYLLLGALFLGIGAQASTVREVQTMSMPVTMGQLVVFAFASSVVADPDGRVAMAATIFPWSSPFAMLARAAQDGAIWPHLLAIVWQALWIALIIRLAAKAFRRSVLKSGRSGRRGWFRKASPTR